MKRTKIISLGQGKFSLNPESNRCTLWGWYGVKRKINLVALNIKQQEKRGAKAFRTPTTMNWTAITVTNEILVPVRSDFSAE